jgi:predicted ester cyclase
VRGFYESIAAALPDLHVNVLSEFDVPGCSIREAVVTGTHKGKFAGVQPLGKAICIEMAAFYTFDEESGKLISERIYYDQASVAEQMPSRGRRWHRSQATNGELAILGRRGMA